MGSPENQPKEKDSRIPYHHILRLQEQIFALLFEQEKVAQDDFSKIGKISSAIKEFANNPVNSEVRNLIMAEKYAEGVELMLPELSAILKE